MSRRLKTVNAEVVVCMLSRADGIGGAQRIARTCPHASVPFTRLGREHWGGSNSGGSPLPSAIEGLKAAKRLKTCEYGPPEARDLIMPYMATRWMRSLLLSVCNVLPAVISLRRLLKHPFHHIRGKVEMSLLTSSSW
jgi:hypothetical protein